MQLILEGRQKKNLIVDNNVVKIIRDKGLIDVNRVKTIAIEDIKAVVVKKHQSFVTGCIQFLVDDNKTQENSYDMSNEDNSIIFGDKKSYEKALRVKEYIENFAKNKE